MKLQQRFIGGKHVFKKSLEHIPFKQLKLSYKKIH